MLPQSFIHTLMTKTSGAVKGSAHCSRTHGHSGGGGDQISKLPITRRTALPPEPQRSQTSSVRETAPLWRKTTEEWHHQYLVRPLLCVCDDLTIDHGEPLQILIGLQLLGGTQRHTQRHGFDFSLNKVDIAGIQEENKPEGTRSHDRSKISQVSLRVQVTVGGKYSTHHFVHTCPQN